MTDKKKSSIKKITLQQFARSLKRTVEKNPDSRFMFFLGAGCSISSKIPGANELVQRWLPELKHQKTGDSGNYYDWAKKEYPEKFDLNNLAKIYNCVIRQRAIERLTDGKNPSFGYIVLAQLMADAKYGKNFSAVLTTNFDDLVADALYLFTTKKPLVITHESLVGYLSITRNKPQVFKLHGDAMLSPKNTETETAKFAGKVTSKLNELLAEAGIIFLGYGANDKSVATFLGKG